MNVSCRPLAAPAVLLLLMLVVPAADLAAQTPTGTIAGRVTLAGTGSPVHAAAVIVVGTRRTAVSNDRGEFEIADLPPGSYDVLAQREHFSSGRQRVTVTAGQVTSVVFELAATGVHEEITVTGTAGATATTFESFSSVRSFDSLELAENRGATIAETLANEPGIAVRSFGAGSARPIIRGFDGDRVLIMQDGVRTGDLSSQSGDHGVSIDPASLERVEVIKGPATLLYGSNAIGGVVNAITPQDAFRTSPFNGVLGGISVDAGSANGQAGGSGNVQYGRGGFTVWGGGGSRRTGDYATPAGPVDNSATRLGTARLGFGWTGPRAFVSAGGAHERSRFGVPFAGQFHAHGHDHDQDVPGEDQDDHPDVGIRSRRTDLRLDGGLLELPGSVAESLKVVFARTTYRHDEIESDAGIESLGTRFDNETFSLRAELEQAPRGRLTGRLGLEVLGRDFRAAGAEALAPPTTQSSVSAFAYEEVGLGSVRLQLGGRVERTGYEPDERPALEVHDEGENGDHDGHEHDVPAARSRTFTGTSGSVGVHADIGTRGALVANLVVASRAPALEELYNFGPHVGNLAFEIGNPDLRIERTFGVDVSLRSRGDRGSAELNAYLYEIDNFVFLDFTGLETDGLREAEFLQGDSRFAGMEASADFRFANGVGLEGGLSFVRARLTGTDEWLPRIPPLSGHVAVHLPWRGVTVNPELVLTAAQNKVFRDETRTAGSGVVNLSATYFVARGHATHSITVKGYNLTNREYRLHTSFIKELAPEMGRGVRATYTVRFF